MSYAPVTAPPSAPPRVGLIASALEPTDETGGRWVNGIAFDPEACAGGSTTHECAEGAGTGPAAKTIDVADANVDYRPVVLWHGDTCSAMDFGARDFAGRANRALLAREHFLLERELWSGTESEDAGYANAFLTDGGATVLNNSTANAQAIPFITALGRLQFETPNHVSGRAMFHAPRDIANAWVAEGAARREGTLILDAFDNLIVAGEGYPGTGPTGQARPANRDTGWVYATSLVTVRRGPIRLVPSAGDPSAAVNRETNLVEWRAERFAAAYWDQCAHLAINVDLCTAYCDPFTGS